MRYRRRNSNRFSKRRFSGKYGQYDVRLKWSKGTKLRFKQRKKY